MLTLDPLVLVLAGVAVVILGTLWLRLHAVISLLLGALVVAALREPSGAVGVITEGFGSTCAQMGILVALASIIGACLLESGAAERIVHTLVTLVGRRRAPVALAASSFILAIPVFFDTVFYLMVPLARALSRQTGRGILLFVLMIVAGATMAHSLVPPTPGPIFVAETLGIDLGDMVLGGLAVGVLTVAVGVVYSYLITRRFDVPLRPLEGAGEVESRAVSIESAPPFWLSILPIALPVVLIAASSVVGAEAGAARDVLAVIGEKNAALALGCAVALVMYALRRGVDREERAASIRRALSSAGVIVLITASGGAFGKALQATGIAERISELSAGMEVGLVPLAFFVTTAIRTAQGSATVAMITAAGIFAETAAVTPLPFHPVYLALAIGCGSKPFSWMNDSGFWVVCKMSGFTEAECLKFYTPLSALMGFVGLGVVAAGAAWLPLV